MNEDKYQKALKIVSDALYEFSGLKGLDAIDAVANTQMGDVKAARIIGEYAGTVEAYVFVNKILRDYRKGLSA